MDSNIMKVKDLIGKQIIPSIDGMRPVAEAIKILDSCDRHAVAVTLGGKFAGVFSYVDFVHRVVMKGRHPKDTLVMEVTTMDPITVSPDHNIHEAFDLMSKRGYSHLPVLSPSKELLGIISHDDLKIEIAKSVRGKTEEADWLRAYINGEPYSNGYPNTITNAPNKKTGGLKS